jgi:hypothetical protein
MVLENICSFINNNLRPKENIKFITDTSSFPTLDFYGPTLTKLHGSADTGDIVPPTWNKNVDKTIIDAWKQAYLTLFSANHLRIIGYSLPTADSYVKYLLKSAVIHAPHLKSIEVICKDSDGSVKRRYDEFIKFNYYKFLNTNVLNYLEHVVHETTSKETTATGVSKVSFVDKLESAHKDFLIHFDQKH